MNRSSPRSDDSDDPLFALALDLNAIRTAPRAVDRTTAALDEALARPVTAVWRLQGSETVVEGRRGSDALLPPPTSIRRRLRDETGTLHGDGISGPAPPTGGPDLLRSECFAAVGSARVLHVGTFDPGGFDRRERRTIDRAAACLDAALRRMRGDASAEEPSAATRDIGLDSFRRAVEAAADGVAILDDETYVYVDQTHVDMYGFERKEQLLGKSWRELYATDEIERIEAEAFPALESTGHWRGRVTGSRPDGSTFPAELSLTMVNEDRLVCTVRDRTAWEARDRELKLKDRAIDEADVAVQIAAATRDGYPLVYVNDGFEALTGYDRSDVLGETPRFLLGDGTKRRKRDRLSEAVGAGDAETVELKLYDADDEPYWARLSVTPVRDDRGTVTHFVAIQQDVTERRERIRWVYRLFEHGPLMFVQTRDTDDGAVIEECDPSFSERLGYDRKAVTGERLAAFYAEGSVSALESDGYERALSGELTVAERELVTADGDRIPCLLRAVPRYPDDKPDADPIGTDVLFVDISERRAQEETLSATRERYRTLLRSAPDPVFVTDGATGAVLETNAAAEALRSEPRADILGRHYTELFPESDREAYQALFDEGTDGVVSTLDDGTQTKLATVDGDTVPVETNLSTVELPDKTVTYGVFRDVSEREKYLQRLEAVFNDSFQFTLLLRPDGTVVTTNDTTTVFTGADRSSLTGRPVDETPLVAGDGGAAEQVREAVNRAAAGETVRSETRLRSARGVATVELSVKPVTDADGDITLLVMEGNDITVRERRRQHLQVLQRVLRHNVRNDVNKLRGWSEVLAGEPDSTRRAEHLTRVNGIFDSWEKMTEDIRRIERVLDVPPRDHDRVAVAALVDDVVTSRRRTRDEATVCSLLATDGSAEVQVALGGVLEELIDNAVTAGGREDPRVGVRVSRRSDGWVRLEVCDDGPGIPKMEADVLVTGEETALHHGRGLGVWLVRMVTTHLGGEIKVDATDAGTRVEIRLPIPSARDDEREPTVPL
jgi:PAS domain S-box-containing protein